MTALALPTPDLVRSDLLKLRRRRGLAVVVSILTVVALAATYTIIELFHVANPARYGVAGGVENLGHGAGLLSMLGAAAAAIIGTTAAVGDLDAGVYRDLVVTGRSRVALLLARLVGGLLYLVPFVVVAFGVACAASLVWTDAAHPAPSTHLLLMTGLWTVLSATIYYVLAFSLACITGSRSYTIGIVLAFRLALTPLLASISALGVVRELVPGVALSGLAPEPLTRELSQGNLVPMSASAAVAVLVVWTAVALRAGLWRDTHRDA
jgi:ABC-type transport system involved in multi-copper enzyme maturation permease subunit